jgi:hypothetical protein
MMNEVFVVYYDVYYPDSSERRRIECVVDSVEKARAAIHELNKRLDVTYANFESFEVE